MIKVKKGINIMLEQGKNRYQSEIVSAKDQVRRFQRESLFCPEVGKNHPNNSIRMDRFRRLKQPRDVD